MTNEEAIKQLKITKECDVDTVAQIKAIDVAIAALRGHPTGAPLTLEQLREMNGQPVWVEFEDGSGGLWGIAHKAVFHEIIFANGLHCRIGHPYYGKTYKAYDYPPAHIDQEAWEPCEYCNGAKYVYGQASAVVPNGDKGQIEKEIDGDFDYCPECGRPLTPEAWAMLENRLRG